MKCLAKAMDETFTEAFGKDWFAAFFKDDQTYPKSMRICQYNVKRERYPQNIRELDFQGYIKILSFRDTYTKVLFERYPISSSADPAVMEKEQERLQEILKRLRRDFRNSAFAHVTLEDYMEQEQGGAVESLYSMEEVAQDIKTLSRIFRTVTDENGRSYYDLIAEDIARQVLGVSKTPTARRISLQWICKNEQLGITPEQLYRCCTQLDLTVGVQKKQRFLETADYDRDVSRIRELLLQEQVRVTARKSRRSNVVLTLIAVAATVLLVGVCGLWAGKEVIVDPLIGMFAATTEQELPETVVTTVPTIAPTTKVTTKPTMVFPDIPGVDVQALIDEHDGNVYKSIYVGQSKALFADLVASGGHVYSVREDRLTVAADGTVTGVGRGQAHVICTKADGTLIGVYLMQVM